MDVTRLQVRAIDKLATKKKMSTSNNSATNISQIHLKTVRDQCIAVDVVKDTTSIQDIVEDRKNIQLQEVSIVPSITYMYISY